MNLLRLQRKTSAIAMHFILLAIGYFVGPSAIAGGLLPGQFPMQEQALETSARFLQAMDKGLPDKAFPFISEQMTSRVNQHDFIAQSSDLSASLGGSADRREIVSVESSPPQQGYRPGNYLVINYRSLYPRGIVNESITMFLEQDINPSWKVVGWWVTPAKY